MNTVITITDREGWKADTDNIAIVEPVLRRILWIPRDLWSKKINDRINKAFARGGHKLLKKTLKEYKISVDSSICLQRSATTRIIESLRVWVPVKNTMKFLYPLKPTLPIEEGNKLITFNPPGEWLSGERIHQWIGARITPKDFESRNLIGSDLNRIERQKVFVRSLIAQRFDFRKFIEKEDEYSTIGSRGFEDLRNIGPDWTMETYGPLEDTTIDGKMVLIKKRQRRRIDPMYFVRRLMS